MVLLTTLIVFSLAGMRYGIMMPLSPVRIILNDITGYVGDIVTSPVRTIKNSWDSYINLREVRLENEILRARLKEMRTESTHYRDIILENRRLKRLLKISEEYQGKVVVADVIGYDLVPWLGIVTINKGKKHGVKKDSIVLSGQETVGRVIETYLNSSKVMLISDYKSAVAAMIMENRARGILYGSGNKLCSLNFVEKDVRVEAGDTVITSGTDGVFPKGLLLGAVESVEKGGADGLFQSIKVKPACNLARIEEVVVPVDQ